MKPELQHKRRTLVVGGVSTLVVVCALGVFFRVSGPDDLIAYRGMAGGIHPVWKQFAFRQFGVGDSASDFFQRHPPSVRESFGRYELGQYYTGDPNAGIWMTGLSVRAKDGKLTKAQAWSCTWQLTFFEAKDLAFEQEFAAHLQAKLVQRKLDRPRRQQIEDRK